MKRAEKTTEGLVLSVTSPVINSIRDLRRINFTGVSKQEVQTKRLLIKNDKLTSYPDSHPTAAL